MQETATTLLKTKPHFQILDGLRGIAAVSVVIFHFMEIAVPDYTQSFIAHAYLAVDFFFCLSGFVIAYAYDDKLIKMGVLNFFTLRLLRLHPLVIIGSVIGLLVFVFDPFSNLYTLYSGKTLLLFLSSCLMIPYAIVHERYFNIFHLNPPAWSLFWEYIANIYYALLLVKFRSKTLWMLTAIAAAALCYESYRSGYLGVGWSGDNIISGGIRVFYSFTAGILVYRSEWMIRNRLGFVGVSLLLIAVFLIPYSDHTNKIVDPVIVILYFPLLIIVGAGTHLKASFSRICNFLGEISYPLYMVHYPFIWLFMSYAEKKKPGIHEMIGIIITGTLLLILLAWAVMIMLDIPIRTYLKNRIKKYLTV